MYAPYNSIDRKKSIGTLNYIRFQDACTPSLENYAIATDEYGNAEFTRFNIAQYEYYIVAQLDTTTFTFRHKI